MMLYMSFRRYICFWKRSWRPRLVPTVSTTSSDAYIPVESHTKTPWSRCLDIYGCVCPGANYIIYAFSGQLILGNSTIRCLKTDYFLKPLRVLVRIVWNKNLISRDKRKEKVPFKEDRKEEPNITRWVKYSPFYTVGQVIIPLAPAKH